MGHVRIQFPAVSAPVSRLTPLQAVSRQSVGEWGLAIPPSGLQMNCFAIAVEWPKSESDTPNTCQDNANAIVATPQMVLGGYAAGSEASFELTTGPQRIFYLIGFATDLPELCVNFTQASGGLDSTHFSPPVILDRVMADVTAGEVVVKLGVPTAVDSTKAFDDCTPVGFKSVTLPSPTPSISPTPTLPTITMSSMIVSESSSFATFGLALNAAVNSPVTVDLTTVNGTALAGSDYSSVSQTVTFPANQTTATVSIPIVGDMNDEDDENLYVHLANPSSNAQLGMTSATVTIQDDDNPPVIQFSAASYPVIENAGSVTIAASLSVASGKPVTVNLSFAGSAVDGTDYTQPATAWTIAPGMGNETLTIPILNDSAVEAVKTIQITMTSASNALTGAPATTVVQILDDEEVTAIPSGMPVGFVSSNDYNISVGGTEVAKYQYWVGAAPDCSTAVYSGEILSTTAISGSLAGDGPRILCLKGISSGGTVQATPTTRVWSVDTTPPTSPTILTDRVLNSSVRYSPIYSWSPGSDSGSGVLRYEYAVGTTSGGSEVVSWTEAPLLGALFLGGLSLSDGQTYYVSLRTKDNAGNFSTVAVDSWMVDLTPAWVQQAYVKASNGEASDNFGTSVAIDGDRMVVGVPSEDSNQNTVTNGAISSADNSALSAGAVYVYERASGGVWSQVAYLKASNAQASDLFGTSVDIQGDTIVVGAPGEDSNQTTITNGSTASTDNSAGTSGAVYVFRRVGGLWSQEAYIKAPNSGSGDAFGQKVALSKDTLAVSAPNEDSSQSTITNGITASSDNTMANSGAVYVFSRSGTTWAPEAYLKAPNVHGSTNFGSSLDISGDTIVVGSSNEMSNMAGIINGTTASMDTSLTDAGAAYVFVRSAGLWSQQAYLKPSNVAGDQFFGDAVAIFKDTIVVGAWGEDSADVTVDNTDGSASSNASASNAGAAYVFKRSAGTWLQTAYLKASNAEADDVFGGVVGIHGDTIVVGATNESSNAVVPSYGGTASADNSAPYSGAVYVFQEDAGGIWTQSAYLKAPNAGNNDFFGSSVAMSGISIVAGAIAESSNQTTITNGVTASANNSASGAGAVYVFNP